MKSCRKLNLTKKHQNNICVNLLLEIKMTTWIKQNTFGRAWSEQSRQLEVTEKCWHDSELHEILLKYRNGYEEVFMLFILPADLCDACCTALCCNHLLSLVILHIFAWWDGNGCVISVISLSAWDCWAGNYDITQVFLKLFYREKLPFCVVKLWKKISGKHRKLFE